MSNKPHKIKSGIKQGLIKPYTFAEHYWSLPVNRNKQYSGVSLTPLFDSMLEFAKRVVVVDGIYWMKNGISDVWSPKKSETLTKKEIANLWLGQQVGQSVCTPDFIDTYINGEVKIPVIDPTNNTQKIVIHKIGSCPQLNQPMSLPFQPEAVVYKDQKYLNIWSDEIMRSDEQHKAMGGVMLRLIYRALCNGPELSHDPDAEIAILEKQIIDNDYRTGEGENTDFMFLMNWLAAIYQNPGINLLTNVWLCGALEGIGKGSLVRVMRRVLGENVCGVLSQSDIERGWNDHLANRVFIEVNELDPSLNKKSGCNEKWWANWIKNVCNEETFNVNGRGTKPFTTINIGNYMFTTNSENPIFLDRTDRRNHLIKTTDDPYWIGYATAINTQMLNPKLNEVAAGFAWYLERVDVDIGLVSRAIANTFKQGIIGASRNVVEEWILNDPMVLNGREYKARDLYLKEFKEWMEESCPGAEVPSETTWGRMMSKTPMATKGRTNGSVTYKINNTTPPLGTVVPNKEQAAASVEGSIKTLHDSTLPYTDRDSPVVIEAVDKTKRTAMDKIRDALRRMDSEHD